MSRLLPHLLLGLLLVAGGCRTSPAPAGSPAPATRPARRPAHWAQPLTLPGLPNLHRVSQDVYRSAQPTAEGYAAAARHGIKAVLCLRTGDMETEAITGAGLTLHRVPFPAWEIRDDDVIQAMRILRQASCDGPVLVHCLHGADRTGLVSAAYRILFEGWTKDDAIAELTQGGFGFHPLFANIPHYLRSMEPEKIRAAVQAGP